MKTKNLKNWTQADLGQTPDPLLTRFSLSLASVLNYQALFFFQNMCLIQLLSSLLPLPLFMPPPPLPSTTRIDLWPASLFPLLLLAFHAPYYNKIIFFFKEMATHSSVLAWKIPWMEEPSRLQSMGSQRVRHDWATWHSFTFIHRTPLLKLFNVFPLCLESSPNTWPWLQGPCDLTSAPAASLSLTHYNLTTLALG